MLDIVCLQVTKKKQITPLTYYPFRSPSEGRGGVTGFLTFSVIAVFNTKTSTTKRCNFPKIDSVTVWCDIFNCSNDFYVSTATGI